MAFVKATKQQAKARVALIGPSGSGKTYTALEVATNMGQRVALIDTERKSASLYSDIFEFDSDDLTDFSPASYIKKIREAEAGGYDVLIIDSLSHAWAGPGGVLEMVDDLTAASRSKNAFNEGWRKATPEHNRLVEALLGCRCHLICTIRSKVEYVLQENERGQKIPTKVGMQPVQRADLDYEFTITADLDRDNIMRIDKTRCPALKGKSFQRDGAGFSRVLTGWLSDGAAVPDKPLKSLADELGEALDAAYDAPGRDAASAQVTINKAKLEPFELQALAKKLKECNERIRSNGAAAKEVS